MLMTAFVGRFKRKYILLIEDIAKYRIGDQINGCSTDDARHAISSLATLHAHYWESAKLRETAWIVPFSMTARFTHMMYLSAYKKFKEQNKDWLDVRQNDMLDWLSNNALLLMKKISKVPLTLNHGDFRLDNLCFDDEHGEVIVFDWQTPVRGPGTFDLAYFLSNSCKVSEAPALIKYYQDQMASRGIDIDTEELKWQFDASMMLMLHRVAPFFYQDMLDFGDERGAILMTNWVKAIYSQLDDVDYKNLV
jgi:aminoglycoside/choline kinase family phosphotransferase